MSMPEAIDAAHISQARSHPSSTIPPEPGYELLDLNNVQEAVSLSGTNRSKTRIFAILVGLYLSLFIAALDQTIVATAIPTISADLHSSTGFVWIGGAYLLANAAGGPIWAALSDIWGRKPVLLIVVVWFFVSLIMGSGSNRTDDDIVGCEHGVCDGEEYEFVDCVQSFAGCCWGWIDPVGEHYFE